ncbi:hypothetical protein [Vibrio mediterranei]|uniref:hypothetical protein n=1 Tax=Vibrio mediterranei TaxID=689 RepID=UPI00156BE7A7|nr:hypothetical protein [Vibrio mediterranei]
MRTLLVTLSLIFVSFSSFAENGGAPGTICQMESGQVITTHLDRCPKNTTKL